MAIATLTIDIIAKLATLTASMESAKRTVGSAVKDMESTLGKIGIGLSVAGVMAFANRIEKAFADAEKAVVKLDTAMRITGGSVGIASDELKKMADELSKNSLFDDKQILRGEAALLRFRGVQGETFKEATKLALDYAAATGTDVVQAFEKIGIALTASDPARPLRALKDAGVVLTPALKDAIQHLNELGDVAGRQQLILGALRKTIGGQSAAENVGITGSVTTLDKAWTHLMEALGKSTFGDAGEGARGLATGLDFVTKHIDNIIAASNRLSPVLGPLIAIAKMFGGDSTNKGPSAVGKISKPLDPRAVLKEQFNQFDELNPLNDQKTKTDIYKAQLVELKKFLDSGIIQYSEYKRRVEALAPKFPHQALDSSAKAAQNFIDQLLKQAEQLGMTKEQLLQYEAAHLKLNDTQKKSADAAIASIQAFDDLAEATKRAAENADIFDKTLKESDERALAQIEDDARATTDAIDIFKEQSIKAFHDLQSPAEQLAMDIQAIKNKADELGLDKAWADPIIEGLQKMYDESVKTKDGMDQYAKTAAKNIQNSFADFLFDPFKSGLSGMIDGFTTMLRRMAAEAAAAQIARNLFGSFTDGGSGDGLLGGFLKQGLSFLGLGSSTNTVSSGSIIPGSFADMFRASGGTVFSDKPYIVGEKGPELFVPKQSGSIVPNTKIGSNVINISFAITGAVDRRTQSEIAATAGQAVSMAMRRNR